MVIYPGGIWYRYTSQADVDEILVVYVKQGGWVERLMLKPEDGPAKRAE